MTRLTKKKRVDANYFVFTGLPAWPSKTKFRVGAVRIGHSRAATLDCLPPTVGKLVTVQAKTAREAVLKSGLSKRRFPL